jgi:hypothetical protein
MSEYHPPVEIAAIGQPINRRTIVNLQAHELQNFLRQFEPLAGVNVRHANELRGALAPHVVVIEGAVNIHGEYHVWETEVNLTHFDTGEDLLLLVKSILQSFEKAARQQMVPTEG